MPFLLYSLSICQHSYRQLTGKLWIKHWRNVSVSLHCPGETLLDEHIWNLHIWQLLEQ